MKRFTITLSTLKNPRDICYLIEKRKSKYFNYTFECNSEIIKHGKASDNEWMCGTWGNRLYRQAGGIQGWRTCLNDTSAKKMRIMMEKHFPKLTKNDITITVYDYTDELTGKTANEISKFLLNEEHKLVKLHVQNYGVPPKLNIQATPEQFIPMFDEFFEVSE